VATADGARTEAEKAFLAQLASALGLPATDVQAFGAQADAIVAAPVASAARGQLMPDDAAIDKRILDASITNAALELLPETLASMAIIPLQMRLVYRIAKAHGYELDRDQIKELLATLGVGMAGQYLEQVGRKLIGGLLGGVAGGFMGSIARGTTGVAFSFATTYAIGQVARRYYAGGRTMNAELLRQAFDDLLQQGRALQARYVPQIEQQARAIDVGRLVQFVKAA
jgi:uncharacterized protein (DUF697 family)